MGGHSKRSCSDYPKPTPIHYHVVGVFNFNSNGDYYYDVETNRWYRTDRLFYITQNSVSHKWQLLNAELWEPNQGAWQKSEMYGTIEGQYEPILPTTGIATITKIG